MVSSFSCLLSGYGGCDKKSDALRDILRDAEDAQAVCIIHEYDSKCGGCILYSCIAKDPLPNCYAGMVRTGRRKGRERERGACIQEFSVRKSGFLQNKFVSRLSSLCEVVALQTMMGVVKI